MKKNQGVSRECVRACVETFVSKGKKWLLLGPPMCSREDRTEETVDFLDEEKQPKYKCMYWPQQIFKMWIVERYIFGNKK